MRYLVAIRTLFVVGTASAGLTSTLAAQATGSFSYEDNNGLTGQVVIQQLSDTTYGVTFTPTGGQGTSQVMTRNATGDLTGTGKFTLIQSSDDSCVGPGIRYGTVDQNGTAGSVQRGSCVA